MKVYSQACFISVPCLPRAILLRQNILLLLTGLFFSCSSLAQTTVPLSDLSAFNNPPASWSLAGDAFANINQNGVLTTVGGYGILVNNPANQTAGDLVTKAEYGDIDLEFDYLLAKGANSGIYLQDRYEIQLMDSWGVKTPTYSDNGGIYERWDESRGKGHEGYEGYAPRQNASKAPGLWQHLKVSFQAPRFDAGGHKTENAKMLRIELNGVLIHEDVELEGPTRGAVSNGEAALAPLRFQGSFGAVAFRNITITSFNKLKPQITNIKYALYKGNIQSAGTGSIKPATAGSLPTLSAGMIHVLPTEYYIRYTGTLKITEPGAYSFIPYVFAGQGDMTINGQRLKPVEGKGGRSVISLPAGELPFELLLTKTRNFSNAALGLKIAGPGIREYFVGDEAALTPAGGADPIFVNASENTILRSFMDLNDTLRLTHAVNVGSPQQIHYTYDLEKGFIAQVWRGGFLDASPMWIGRGDGSSRPTGAVQGLGKPVFTIAKLASATSVWPQDTVGSNYRPHGYRLDKNGAPIFRYSNQGIMVEDAIIALENGEGFTRSIQLENSDANCYALLARNADILSLGNGLFQVGDKSYYIKLPDGGESKAILRESNGQKELLLPVQNAITYSILF